MRPMVPLQANMASLRTVLPEDACPTMAKLRIFAEGCVAIAPRMKLKWLVCKLRETKALISHNVQSLAAHRFGAHRSKLRTLNDRSVQLSLDGVADKSARPAALDVSKGSA